MLRTVEIAGSTVIGDMYGLGIVVVTAIRALGRPRDAWHTTHFLYCMQMFAIGDIIDFVLLKLRQIGCLGKWYDGK